MFPIIGTPEPSPPDATADAEPPAARPEIFLTVRLMGEQNRHEQREVEIMKQEQNTGKQEYTAPTAEIIQLDSSDVIYTSVQLSDEGE